MEISTTGIPNCPSKCLCRAPSSSSFQNLPVSSSPVPLSAPGRSSCSQAGALFFQGRVSSIRCFQGQELRESNSGWNDKRRFLASATKDSSRDVFLQTGSHDPRLSQRRGESPRSGQPVENTVSQRAEAEEKDPASPSSSEEGQLLDTDPHCLTSEGASTEVNNEEIGVGKGAAIGTVAAGLGLIVALGGFIGASVVYKDQINEYLIHFSDFLEGALSAMEPCVR